MGGCCCCSSRGVESGQPPAYYYCPRDLEEHEQLSSTNHDTLPATSLGLLVDTNLDTSTPDTYQSPPAPLPYDTSLESQSTLPGDVEIGGNKTDQTPILNSRTTGQNNDCFETSDCKKKTDSEKNSPKINEDEISKPATISDEEDVCPICLEDYDAENPRISTKCEHHFHLSCILEWMERSDTCAICDQIMMIDNMYNTMALDQSP
ncbi:probable E3 ubiquitin-protein ligase RHB1A [Zingiber officinale]|uniref:probable E3 ubiquitin-protein ligase RHB1A n=1 Tax=Zingiber officinale TaxID=94328 RepID=UPI001C4D1F7C|nr:probable E3 ubiquitin-protein ligase RHB1A [Zingiber officinale]